MSPELIHLCAAAAMIERLKKVVELGVLPEALEQDTRVLIVRAANAFQFDATPASNVINLEDATLDLVRKEMARTM